jgi:hypothetical protein
VCRLSSIQFFPLIQHIPITGKIHQFGVGLESDTEKPESKIKLQCAVLNWIGTRNETKTGLAFNKLNYSKKD